MFGTNKKEDVEEKMQYCVKIQVIILLILSILKNSFAKVTAFLPLAALSHLSTRKSRAGQIALQPTLMTGRKAVPLSGHPVSQMWPPLQIYLNRR